MKLSKLSGLLLFGTTFAVVASAATCDSLTSLSLPDTTISLVQRIPAGALDLPAGRGPNAAGAYKDLPAFCRVFATLKPTSDSDIKIEVWLPESGWNGKFQAVGNGGWAGVISFREMSEALKQGYATASTDTGHVGGRGQFALGHPEKLIDFAWRSEHEMTVKSKAIVKEFYGKDAKYSYWNGCSTGGRQGLKEAQKFPDDYDGIIAGAPANRTPLALWVAFAELKDPATYIPKEKYPAIHQAVLQACDAQDGAKDGLIEDPTSCHFDPKVMLCKGADNASCLTAPQAEAVRKIFSPATNPRTGQVLFPSLVPGSELGFAVLGGGPEPSQPILDQLQFVVYKDPHWDWKTFDFDKDVARFDKPENLVMNATDPNLSAFFKHNGKLLLYHGWSDPNITPLTTIQYYKSVVDTMGGTAKTSNNVRLFLEPGMGHCGGGEGPNVFDKVGALEHWVETGKAPEVMIASHLANGAVDRTRPLCPYPQVAQYTGNGSTDDAKNFVCREVSK